MTQTTPTPTADSAPQESDADFLARLESDTTAPAPGLADGDAPPPARPEDAAPSTRDPARPGDPTPPEGAGAAAPPATDDPITSARREERAAADREWQARLNGVHGNVKQLQDQLAREKARADAHEAQREREYQQLIDAAATPEDRQDWENRRESERKLFAAEQVLAGAAAREQLAQASQQQQVATATNGLRGAAVPAITASITGYATEVGFPAEEVADLVAAETGQSADWLYRNMPPLDLVAHLARRSLDLQPVIDRRAASYKTRQAAGDEQAAAANRARDGATGRFAAAQPGATGAGGDRYARMSDADFLALLDRE